MKPVISKGKTMLDEASCIYGAGVLLGFLNALEQEVEGISAGLEDIEYIHRARVASRRLRAALPLFLDCMPEKKAAAWVKQIRNVTRALGAARDLDVQIESVHTFFAKTDDPRAKPGLMRLHLRLRQQRARIQPQVISAVQKLAAGQTIPAMRQHLSKRYERRETVYLYTPVLYQLSFDAIHAQLVNMLAYRAFIFDPEKVLELHQMRIAAKRLRYTMETFAPLYASQLGSHLKVVRRLQEQLGDIHDSDVWQQFLETFLADEREKILEYFGNQRPFPRLVSGIQAFEQDRRRARDAAYQEFLIDWQKWENKGIWNNLTKTTQVPFHQPETIYPPLNQPDSATSPG